MSLSLKNNYELITSVDEKANSKYAKPDTGIPKSDLDSGIQTSLTNADGLPALNNKVDNHSVDYVSHTGYSVTTGSANTYIAALTPALSAYKEGVSIRLKINVANTGASTININGLGAKTIKKQNGNALTSGNLKAGSVYTLVYDGASFILQGEGGEYGTAVVNDVRKGKTIGTENGIQTGTLDLDNAIATNIKEGVSIAGVAGNLKSLPTPASGNLPIATSMGLGYTNSTTATVVQTLKVTMTGTYQVFFNLWIQSNSQSAYAYAVLQCNGVNVTQSYRNGSQHPIIIYNTLTLNAGDVLTVKLNSDTEWVWAYCTNLGLAINVNPYATLTIT